MGLRDGLITAGRITLVCLVGRHVFMLMGVSGSFDLVAVIWWFWMGLATAMLGIGFIFIILVDCLGISFLAALFKPPVPAIQN